MKIVIIGGVAAGASAAARARRLSEKAEITILEKGKCVSFGNCGMPYHIGGVIKKRDDLLITSPEYLRDAYNIDIRTENEVIKLDRKNHIVHVLDHSTGSRYEESYDKLILCQGAAPIRPALPGFDHEKIFVLRDMTNMDEIKAVVDAGAENVLVIGANYIGMEVCEALRNRGLHVDMVEMQDQIMPIFDREMASDLQSQLENNGVQLHLGTIAESFCDMDGKVEASLSNGEKLKADFVVLSIGVRPESGLASKAGLEIGPYRGVRVDQHMRTTDPDVYAAGDMVEVINTITGEPSSIPLAGPANRQGRTAANHIFGRTSSYRSSQNTSIIKVFDMTAASTGASEKNLRRLEQRFHKIYLHPLDHASYYPGASFMHIKVLFNPIDGKLLGAQIVGYGGVDKRIDILATAVRAGIPIQELEHLELAYSPPYGAAKDPINMIGFVGGNLLNGDVEFWYAEDHPSKTSAGIIVDVRSKKEFNEWHISGSINIPIEEIRSRIDEIKYMQEGRPLYLYCYTGIRSYLAYRILLLNGFEHVSTLAGGRRTFESYYRTRLSDGSSEVLFTASQQ